MAKYYILMMKVGYNKILLNEKRKRRLEREIVKIAEKYKVREANVMKEIETLISMLANGDDNMKNYSNTIRSNNYALMKVNSENSKTLPESFMNFE